MAEAAVDPDDRILVLAPTGRDATLTCRLLERAGLHGFACASMASLCDQIEIGAAALLVAEEALAPSAAALLATALAAQLPWSDLPMVVFTSGGTVQSRPPTSTLLAPLGNVTLLDRPVRPATMLAAASAAMRARRRQYAARREMERQRQQVQQRDQFLAMLGHELRNPLGAILLAAEMLDRSSDVSSQRAVILRQVRHVARLVDDLLDVARVTTGKIVLHRTRVELHELVSRCVQPLQASIAGRQTISVRGAGVDLEVDGDAVRLEQVLVNLLTNAVKYTPAGGHIDVTLAQRGGAAVVSVKDDGIGIARDVLPRIFDLFVQADHSLDRAQGGLGIGLTLVRSLVELHDGSVSAHSDGSGKGTEILVRLPLRRQASRSDPGPRPQESTPPQIARHVLVIEDNQDTRELLRALVAGFGHDVVVAADGLEGLAQALKLRPDAMIVDLGLPGIDGFEVARQARAELGDQVTIIALTGYGQPEDRRRALEAGFDVHLVKPVEPNRLQRLLAGGRAVARSPRPA